MAFLKNIPLLSALLPAVWTDKWPRHLVFFHLIRAGGSSTWKDPVERFVSEVNHVRHLLRGETDPIHDAGLITPEQEILGMGWPQELVNAAIDPSVTNVGSFKKLIQSIKSMASICDIRDLDTSMWINRRNSKFIAMELRSSLRSSFVSEYALIQALGVDI